MSFRRASKANQEESAVCCAPLCPLWLKPLTLSTPRIQRAPPRILYPSNCTLMTPKSKSSNGGSRAAVVETKIIETKIAENTANPERERIFNIYRQWGYLEGD